MHFYFPASGLPARQYLFCFFFRKIEHFNQIEKLLIVCQALVSRQFVQNFFHGKIGIHDVTDLKIEIPIIQFQTA